VLSTISVKGEGIDELVEAVDRHRMWLESSGELAARRRRRSADEIEMLAVTALRERIGDLRGGTLLEDLAGEVLAGHTDPYSAADRLIAEVER
jgi:LAO/AO transport system kinase